MYYKILCTLYQSNHRINIAYYFQVVCGWCSTSPHPKNPLWWSGCIWKSKSCFQHFQQRTTIYNIWGKPFYHLKTTEAKKHILPSPQWEISYIYNTQLCQIPSVCEVLLVTCNLWFPTLKVLTTEMSMMEKLKCNGFFWRGQLGFLYVEIFTYSYKRKLQPSKRKRAKTLLPL